MSSSKSSSGAGKNKVRDHGCGWEESGGYMAAKKRKLNDQFIASKPIETEKDGDVSAIFKGVAIHVNGYTKPSSDELKRLMMLHGGRYEHYMSKTRVTHVIATSLASSKVKDFKHVKIIRPEWITDSVKARRLLSYVPYQLYTAQTGLQQGLASFTSTNITQHTTTAASTGTSFINDNKTEDQIDKPCMTEFSVDDGPRDCNTKTDGNSHVSVHENTSATMAAQTQSYGENISVNTDFGTSDNSVNTDFGSSDISFKIPKVGNYSVQPERENVNISTVDMSASGFKSSHSPAKAGDPDFLSEFYSNSRLHHLSTWKSEWRTYVNKLQKQGSSFPGRQKLHALMKEKEMEVSQRVVSPLTLAKRKPQRVIMHIDMDCFFVSVGLKKRPDLKGKPVVVTHSRGKGMAKDNPGSDIQFEKRQWELRRQEGGKKGKRKSLPVSDPPSLDDIINGEDEEVDRMEVDNTANPHNQNSTGDASSTFHSMAEIASCSYEARKAGVKNGMFMGKAKQLCPDLVTIPYDFDGYQEVSKILYDTVASYTHDIEAVSCDEMLVDCTDLLAVTGSQPLEFASILREEIYTKTSCTASAGMGSNILLAKMATKKAKPNGQYYLHAEEVMEFISDQSIDNIPGVGWSMSRKLHDMKVNTCGDLQKLSLSTLQSEFGMKTGQSLYNYCRGQDDRPIKIEQERKSVSAEINYGIRLKNDSEAEHFLTELSEEVHNRLTNIDMKGKSITLKIMSRRADAPMETAKFMGHGICNNTSKSVTLPIATDDSKIISRESITILRNMKVKATDLRGIGIQVQKLEPSSFRNNNMKGAQSILNFAVAKSKTKVVSPPIKPDTTCGNVDDKETAVSGDIPVLLAFDTDIPQREEDDINQNSSDNPDLRQEEQDEILHGIVGELARRKTAKKILPPLPSMADLSLTPEGDESVTASGRLRRTKRNTHLVVPSEDYFPSPSQIDPEVLKELPLDVRKQIEAEIKSRQKKKKERPLVTSESIERPGCSHWSNSQSESTNQHSDTEILISDNEVNDAIVPLPSPSQLDESCLSALPVDLQKELKAAYAQQNKHEKSSNNSRSVWLHQAKSPTKKLTSPQKTKSPGKGKKNSPVFKVPQGRPARAKKKLSPKKLNFQNQPKINTGVSSRKDTMPLLDIEKTAATSKQDPLTSIKSNSVNQRHENKVQKSVNLCGAVTIADVRALLREWLQSSDSAPEIEDEEIMIEYLRDLVFDHNLEQVDLVLKFLNRNIQKLNRVDWIPSLRKILNAVQIVVQSMYGCHLGLPAEFDITYVDS